MKWLLVPFFLTFYGCGTLQKWGLRSSTPVFKKTSVDLMKESNWGLFRASTPANLKLMELLWLQDQENLELLGLLVRGYAGYAFAVPETLLLEDELRGVDDSPWKKDALSLYTRSLDYGLQYLSEKKISREDLLSGSEKALTQKLEELRTEDLSPLLYTAQSWASLINLQKDNVALVSQVPRVKILFDHVCREKPQIDHNVCDIFYAQYESSRPRLLGGNPEKGEKLFVEAIRKSPKNLLIRTSYLQYLIIPSFDEEKFNQQSKDLIRELEKWSDLKRDALKNSSEYRAHPELNLYNAIANKRFEIILKYKNKIF